MDYLFKIMSVNSIGPMVGSMIGMKIATDTALKVSKMNKTRKVPKVTKTCKY